jgi:hypothetical protein
MIPLAEELDFRLPQLVTKDTNFDVETPLPDGNMEKGAEVNSWTWMEAHP